MPAGFPPKLRDTLAAAREITIHTGLTGPAGVVIWVVVIDGAAYVRSFRGRRGTWYAGALADHRAQIEISGTIVPVGVTAVTDPATIAAVSAAYRAKYAGSPYVAAMVADDTLATTLLLAPTA